jgi:hypothetical protein
MGAAKVMCQTTQSYAKILAISNIQPPTMLHLTAILCENGGTLEMLVRLKDTSMPLAIPHPFFEANHTKCLGLSPLGTKVIQWDIPKDGICLLELFGSISLKLSTFL